MNDNHRDFIPRFCGRTIERVLTQFPVVVLTGARQTGKSTLVQHLPSAGSRLYRTLDDFVTLARAQEQPEALLEEAPRMTIDEVQRTPDLLRSIKRAVDRDRRKGRFLLTGSANLLLMHKVSESLAGRALYLHLMTMTEREKRGLCDPGIWGRLVQASSVKELRRSLEDVPPNPARWPDLALAGGFPPAVLAVSADERLRWLEAYTRTYLERDLQEISSIGALLDFRRFMGLASLRIGRIVNQSELGRDACLSQPTVHRYLNLLETSHQVFRLPAFAASRSQRLIKSPKMYWGDSGMAAFLCGIHAPEDVYGSREGGAMLENLILTQILAWREVEVPRPGICYWRTATGAEVDFVIEHRNGLLPIEVKTASRPRPQLAKGLELFLDEQRDRARVGLLLYDGHEIFPLTGRVVAAPVQCVL
ncbi:MAG: ATP-binding protein [Acidobacteria bacterium]|nr:ATP-binding protein [Acidobacteriota bacterium]